MLKQIGLKGIAISFLCLSVTHVIEAGTIFRSKNNADQARAQPNQTETVVVYPYGEVLTEEEVCTSYRAIRDVLKTCQHTRHVREYTVAFIRDRLYNFCSNKAMIRTCVEDYLQNCDTIDSIKALLDVSFSSCDGDGIPIDIDLLLLDNYNANITEDCLDAVVGKADPRQCDRSNRPVLKWNETLEETVVYYQRRDKWAIDCFLKTVSDLNEFILACSMTIGDTFGILVASFQFMRGIGYNAYPLFLHFMNGREDMHAEPLLFNFGIYQ